MVTFHAPAFFYDTGLVALLNLTVITYCDDTVGAKSQPGAAGVDSANGVEIMIVFPVLPLVQVGLVLTLRPLMMHVGAGLTLVTKVGTVISMIEFEYRLLGRVNVTVYSVDSWTVVFPLAPVDGANDMLVIVPATKLFLAIMKPYYYVPVASI